MPMIYDLRQSCCHTRRLHPAQRHNFSSINTTTPEEKSSIRKLNYAVAKAIVLVTAGLMMLGMSRSAEAKTYVNVSTGFCLDSNTAGMVYTLPCNGGNFQNWNSSGKSLVNVSTGFCLDSNTAGMVYTLPCNGGNFQNWNSRGRSLVNVSTGFCLDSNTAGQVYTLPCNGGNFQNWQ